MANSLVTGGAGFIGGHIARRLVDEGESVRVLDDFSTGSRANLADFAEKIELIEGDMRDFETARKAASGMDYVLHLAAMASVPRSVDDPCGTTHINVCGTVNLLQAAREAKVKRFVYSASSSAYGDQLVEVKTESLPERPLSPYAAAKLAGEHFCKAFWHSMGLETICLRYFNIFGPRQDPNSPYSAVIPLFARAALTGGRPTIYGDGSQSRDFTYVENVVNANLLAAKSRSGVGETMNIACGRSFTVLETLEGICEMAGTVCDPIFAAPRPGDVRHSLASIDKARELIGYDVSVGFEEGLRRTVDYYRSAF